MHTRCSTATLLLMLVAMSGCERQLDASADAPSPRPPAGASPAPVAAHAAVGATPDPAASLPLLALSEDGLTLVDADTGATRHLDFAMPFEAVLAILGRLRSDPPRRNVNEDCGAGAMDIATWGDGLSVLGQDGSFAGWSLDAAQAGAPDGTELTTIGGIGLGSSRRALESLQAIEVSQTSLGIEFSAGELYGVLASDAPDAAVVHLWAGVSCIFR